MHHGLHTHTKNENHIILIILVQASMKCRVEGTMHLHIKAQKGHSLQSTISTISILFQRSYVHVNRMEVPESKNGSLQNRKIEWK